MLTRRFFVQTLGKLSQISLIGLVPFKFRQLFAQSDVSADDNFTQRKYVLKNSSVLNIKGRVFINGYAVSVGSRIYPYSHIITPPGSEIVFRLPDMSVFKVAQKSSVKFEISNKYSGVFSVREGALTSVVVKNTTLPYAINTELITLKLYSSVSFFQKLTPNQVFSNTIQQPVAFDPNNANYLFCLCNGSMDLISRKTGYTYWLTEAEHHITVLITEEKEEVKLNKIEQLNHTDLELLELIDSSTPEPYPTDWLKPYESPQPNSTQQNNTPLPEEKPTETKLNPTKDKTTDLGTVTPSNTQ